MEIIKTNENYSIADTTEQGWKVQGTASKEVNGNLNIWFNCVTELGEHIGDYNYSIVVGDKLRVSYNVSEDNKDAYVTYADSVVRQILEYFN